MGFEGKEEERKNEGGNELDERQVEAIVTRVLAATREKGQLSEEIGELRKGIKATNEGLAGLKRLFCSEDGTVCFPTQAELNSYVEKQTKEMKEIRGTLGQVVERINTIKQPPATGLPEGVKVLEPMTEEKRKAMTDEKNRIRDDQVAANDRALNQTSNDRYRQMGETDKDNITKKPDMRQRFLSTLTDQERKDVVLFSCKDGVCKPFREGMEKEEGVKFYVKDSDGNFVPADESEKKPLIF